MGYYVLTAVGTVIAFVTLVAFDGIQEKIRTRRRPELDLQIECDHMGDIMVELSHLAERHFAKLLNPVSYTHLHHDLHRFDLGIRQPEADRLAQVLRHHRRQGRPFHPCLLYTSRCV